MCSMPRVFLQNENEIPLLIRTLRISNRVHMYSALYFADLCTFVHAWGYVRVVCVLCVHCVHSSSLESSISKCAISSSQGSMGLCGIQCAIFIHREEIAEKE